MTHGYVYLSGPITGIHYDDAMGWRQEIVALLQAHGIKAINPMRACEHLQDTIMDNHYEHLLTNTKAITTTCLNDCKHMDVILVNLIGARKVSIGTLIEVAWAKAFGKPIVLVMEDSGNPHEHCIVREISDFIVINMKDAVSVVKHLLIPN